MKKCSREKRKERRREEENKCALVQTLVLGFG